MKTIIAVAAITIIASVTATTAATLIAGNIGSATASTATSSSGSVATRELQTLYAINRSQGEIARELKSISARLGGKNGVVGSGGSGVLDYLWRIAHNTE